MALRLYRAFFVEIYALFPNILRFEFATLFMKHPVRQLEMPKIALQKVTPPALSFFFSHCTSKNKDTACMLKALCSFITGTRFLNKIKILGFIGI